jgi:hypothetical protein
LGSLPTSVRRPRAGAGSGTSGASWNRRLSSSRRYACCRRWPSCLCVRLRPSSTPDACLRGRLLLWHRRHLRRLIQLLLLYELILELLLFWCLLRRSLHPTQVGIRCLGLILLLEHHELLLLLQEGLELLLVKLVEELLAQYRHLHEILSLILHGSLELLAAHGWLELRCSLRLALELWPFLGIPRRQPAHARLVRASRPLLGRWRHSLHRSVQSLIPLLGIARRFPLADSLHGAGRATLRHAEAGEHLRLLRDDHVLDGAGRTTQCLSGAEAVARRRTRHRCLEAAGGRCCRIQVALAQPSPTTEASGFPRLRSLWPFVAVWPPLSASAGASVPDIKADELPASMKLLIIIVTYRVTAHLHSL